MRHRLYRDVVGEVGDVGVAGAVGVLVAVVGCTVKVTVAFWLNRLGWLPSC